MSRRTPLVRESLRTRVTPSGRQISALRASARRTFDKGSGLEQVAGWRTPMAHAARSGCKTLEQFNNRIKVGRQIGLQDQIILVGWATPRAGDADKRGKLGPNPRNGLPMQAQQAGWPTPTSRDHKDGKRSKVPTKSLLGRQVWTIVSLGPTRNGSGVRTPNGDRLNPNFARWLMGYPAAWGNCAPTAMPSSRKSQRRLSTPSKKR